MSAGRTIGAAACGLYWVLRTGAAVALGGALLPCQNIIVRVWCSNAGRGFPAANLVHRMASL
eukprot:3514856-Prorocentrum_lima.AAC.1